MDDFQTRKNIYPDLLSFIEEGKSFVLATVIRTFGSVPQKTGISAIFDQDGLKKGTIGGGMVEYNITKEAVKALKSKRSGYFTFDLNNDIAEKDSPICGGGMEILLDASPEKYHKVFQVLLEAQKNHVPGILVTMLKSGKQEEPVIERTWIASGSNGPFRFKSELLQIRVREMLNGEKPAGFIFLSGNDIAEEDCIFILLEKISPMPQLIIAGAGHVGKALAHLGKLLEFEVTVWDDRPEYANSRNLPDADHILTGSMEDAFLRIKVNPNTFIVIVTRGHHHDTSVLKMFIGSKAGYIGLIGSRNKITGVKNQFLQNGWGTQEQWDRIYAPVGLKIGSGTVQEIAVSIAAQLIQVKNTVMNRDV